MSATINPLFGNPFAFETTPAAESFSDEYAIVRRGSAVAPDVDRLDAEVLEVTARWGRTVLGVAHVAEGASLAIGEDDNGAILIPEALLGARSFTLIAAGALSMPRTGKGSIEADGRTTATIDASVVLTKGMRAKVVLGEGDGAITLTVSRVAAAKPSPRRSSLKKGIFALLAGSVVAHVLFVSALAFSPGASLDEDNTPLDKETSAQLAMMYNTANLREQPVQDEPATTGGATESNGGDTGARHAGTEGMSGTLSAKVNGGAYSLKGPAESPEEHLANARKLIDENKYGALGALSSVLGSEAPIDLGSTFDTELGHDAESHNGNLVGLHAGESYGNFGLGNLGDGPGGGGWSLDGMGLDKVGGFGHGPGVGGFAYGNCKGDNCGSSWGPGGPPGLKRPVGAAGHPIDTNTDEEMGGLPREIVRRIVRANFPRFSGYCYDPGLKRDPSLSGTVKATFIIDTTGAVETVNIVQGLSDPAVNSCVAGVYQTLSFPSVDNGGKTRVTYSIDFENH